MTENSGIIQLFSDKVDGVNSSKGFGILIFMYLGKYFFLLFGVISLFFIIYLVFKKKQ